jgi:hypothetical protein
LNFLLEIFHSNSRVPRINGFFTNHFVTS